MSHEVPSALRALLEAGGALVRRSSSGRVALARAAPLVEAEALPAELRGLPARLEQARERALEPLAFEQVQKTLRGAWGSAPAKVLDDLDPEPLAVTPAAQVHRGELDGEAVAVKVRRPGLAGAVRQDLALLEALAPPLGAVLRAADTGAVLRELRESALDEFDLEHEAGQQRQVRRALRDDPDVVVPAVHGDLAADDVLVCELLAGPTLEQERPGDPGRVARALVTAHVTAWRRAGLVLTDPRPAHVVLLADGRVGLLGTGVARATPRERAAPVIAVLRALRDDDAPAFAEAVRELGVLEGDVRGEAFEHVRAVAGGLLAGAARLDAAALAEVGERALDRLGPLVRLAGLATPAPGDLAPLRMLAQLAAVLSRLEAREDWARLADA